MLHYIKVGEHPRVRPPVFGEQAPAYNNPLVGAGDGNRTHIISLEG